MGSRAPGGFGLSLLLPLVAWTGGCAPTPASGRGGPGATGPSVVVRLPETLDPMAPAFAACRRGEDATCISLLQSALRSSALSDLRMAMAYWLLAAAHARLDHPREEAEALEAFLVASELLEGQPGVDPDLFAEERRVAAATLAARKAEADPAYGSTAETAIRLSSGMEEALFLRLLRCGRDLGGHVRSVVATEEAVEGRLVRRIDLQCSEGRSSRVIFLELTRRRGAGARESTEEPGQGGGGDGGGEGR